MPLAEHCVTQYPTSSNLSLVFARIASQHIVVSTFARFPSPSEATEQVTEELWHAITENDAEPALVSYKIAEKDTRGPFSKKIPEDFCAKADMEWLCYTSPRELLAEKFHMSEDLLRKLNPGASFDQDGQEIVVTNVERDSAPKISRVEVDANRQRVKAYGEGDRQPTAAHAQSRPGGFLFLREARIRQLR
jgi:hypothetical protein